MQILQYSVKIKQDKWIYKGRKKLYKIPLKMERKNSEILTMVVAGIYASKIYFSLISSFL